jgi:flagellar biosynthesis protein FlhG
VEKVLLELGHDALPDQAAGLRRLFRTRTGKAIAFVSGREACGRTKLLVQTAVALAQSGESVLVIDENGGSANVHAAFGLRPAQDLLDAATRGVSVASLALPAMAGLGVVSAVKLAACHGAVDPELANRLDGALRSLQQSHSYVLVDCADRSPEHLSPLALAAPCMAVVVAAQSTAITRAYALIKRLARESGREAFQVVITRAKSDEEAQAIFRNMQATALAHLGVRLSFLAGARQPATDHIAGLLSTRMPHGPVGFSSLRGTAASVAGVGA